MTSPQFSSVQYWQEPLLADMSGAEQILQGKQEEREVITDTAIIEAGEENSGEDENGEKMKCVVLEIVEKGSCVEVKNKKDDHDAKIAKISNSMLEIESKLRDDHDPEIPKISSSLDVIENKLRTGDEWRKSSGVKIAAKVESGGEARLQLGDIRDQLLGAAKKLGSGLLALEERLMVDELRMDLVFATEEKATDYLERVDLLESNLARPIEIHSHR